MSSCCGELTVAVVDKNGDRAGIEGDDVREAVPVQIQRPQLAGGSCGGMVHGSVEVVYVSIIHRDQNGNIPVGVRRDEIDRAVAVEVCRQGVVDHRADTQHRAVCAQ